MLLYLTLLCEDEYGAYNFTNQTTTSQWTSYTLTTTECLRMVIKSKSRVTRLPEIYIMVGRRWEEFAGAKGLRAQQALVRRS